MRRLVLPLALTAALGACAGPGMHPAATSFDGTYTGVVVMTHAGSASMGNGSVCATPGQQPASITVQNGAVTSPKLGGTTFSAPIMADGSFQAQNFTTFFAGKVTNRSMVARGNIGGCDTVYDLSKPA